MSSHVCTLRGYVRVSYVGVYGIGTPYKDPRRLVVREVHSYGRDGNDIGGLKGGFRFQERLFNQTGVWHRSGLRAQMNQWGIPRVAASTPVRCWSGSQVRRLRLLSRHFAQTAFSGAVASRHIRFSRANRDLILDASQLLLRNTGIVFLT